MGLKWIAYGFISRTYVGGLIKVEVWYSNLNQSYMFTGDLERESTKLKADTLEQAQQMALKVTKKRLTELARLI